MVTSLRGASWRWTRRAVMPGHGQPGGSRVLADCGERRRSCDRSECRRAARGERDRDHGKRRLPGRAGSHRAPRRAAGPGDDGLVLSTWSSRGARRRDGSSDHRIVDPAGARDTHAAGDTSGTSPHHGDELAAIATLDLPRRIGGFIVSPGIGLGYAWLDVATSHLDMHSMSFSVAETSHALRADVHLMISRPLGGRFAIYGDLHGDAAMARTDIVADGPRSFLRAAIGIRVEGP